MDDNEELLKQISGMTNSALFEATLEEAEDCNGSMYHRELEKRLRRIGFLPTPAEPESAKLE